MEGRFSRRDRRRIAVLVFTATLIATLFVVVGTASASCPQIGDEEVLEAATVQATATAHPGHTSAHPGYTTLSVTSTGAEKCITFEESIANLSRKIAEGIGAGTLKNSVTVTEGARTVFSHAWEVDHPGEAEEIVNPNSEEEAALRIGWSCSAPGTVGTYVVTSHGFVGPTISNTGQFVSVSAAWCAATKKREARERKKRAEEQKRRSAQYRRERPKREAEARRAKEKEQQEDSSSAGGEARAVRAVEHVVHEEGREALPKCRRTGPHQFYCKFEESPSFRNYHTTVTFEGSHNYVGPIEETL
jgi:hypothetical protein